MKFDSKEEICLEIWGAVMVSSECCGSAQSHQHSCAYVASCLCLCVPDRLDLEFLLCNMALLWAVGFQQGLGPPEMESVLSAPPPLECRGGREEGGMLTEAEGQQKHPSSVDLEDREGQEVGRRTVFSLEK